MRSCAMKKLKMTGLWNPSGWAPVVLDCNRVYAFVESIELTSEADPLRRVRDKSDPGTVCWMAVQLSFRTPAPGTQVRIALSAMSLHEMQ